LSRRRRFKKCAQKFISPVRVRVKRKKDVVMSRLLRTLPPLSPDYSGAASVFHDLRFLTVIHDASGCTGTYTGYDEPRWFGSSSPVFCSGLREMDAIMGDDGKLLARIEAALEDTGAPGVVIIGSPVPLVIGFDFKGFAALVENRSGRPAFAFPATGLGYYDWGQREAYLAMARRFLGEAPAKEARRVNLLGASALDGFDDSVLDLLEALLAGAGFRRGAVWGARSSLEEIRESPGAGANWALTAAALPLARFFRDRYGIPFVAGLPVGRSEEGRILAGLEASARGEEPGAVFPPFAGGEAGRGTLIVGEALIASSLRAWILAGGGPEAPGAAAAGGAVGIASFFPEGRELLRPGDFFFASEDEAVRALAGPDWETLIADPLIGGLAPGDSSRRFIPLPHRAVSGRLHRGSLRGVLDNPCVFFRSVV
jgi:hypothetical protein